MATRTIELTPHGPAADKVGPFRRWLLEGYVREPLTYHRHKAEHHTHAWWQVMCLTGVDYFSTLGYQPGIAALAAGLLSPLATLVLVLLTLFGALPIYRRVSRESPHGEGSIAMLEHLLRWWQGKLFVLALLGFVATDFVITITLSAADAAEHLIENPYLHHHLEGRQVLITLVLVGLLGLVFLKGFREAIGMAVVLVGVYLAMNAVVVGVGLYHVFVNPHQSGGLTFAQWQHMSAEHHGNPLALVGLSLLLFPKLALGLSGFETGVAVMPLVRGEPGDTEEKPEGRIRHTRKLLTTAAVVMSVYLIASSIVTTLLIPHAEFQPGGRAAGRALAFLAHERLGPGFGTAYDASTIAILWFAGASAMAGLLSIVPRYLPRYGMAPEWTRATRPLVLVFTAVAVAVTLIFRADVEAQGGAYATGVLVLMTSGAVAVTLSARKRKSLPLTIGFAIVSVVFLYTTLANVVERPDGVKIAAVFIAIIVLVSLASRIWRTLELRVTKIVLDDAADQFIDEAAKASRDGEIRLVPNRPQTCDCVEYDREDHDARIDHDLTATDPLLITEVYVADPSEFAGEMHVRGVDVGGHKVLRVRAPAVPNALAALLLYLRDRTGKRPHAYFNWSEGNPLLYLIRYLLSGEGDIAPVTREILRRAEPDAKRRPAIHAAM